jgi:sorting nexin-4
MRLRPQRGSSGAEPVATGVFDNFTDTFLNAFTKVHKTDKRFSDIRERVEKMAEDLSNLEKIVARVARREGDLELDYADLAAQFQKLENLEPGVEDPLQAFVKGVEQTSGGLRQLKEHTDQNYLGSLKDMDAYIMSLKALLKQREQKQLDFEALTDYLNKAVQDRDILASTQGSTGLTGPNSFFRAKIEDVRGVDHEQSRRDRLRKLELRIEELTREVEEAKKTTEAFDEEVIRETADFERIKSAEFKDTLGALSQAMIDYNLEQVQIWERFLKEVGEDPDAPGAGGNE